MGHRACNKINNNAIRTNTIIHNIIGIVRKISVGTYGQIFISTSESRMALGMVIHSRIYIIFVLS